MGFVLVETELMRESGMDKSMRGNERESAGRGRQKEQEVEEVDMGHRPDKKS